MKTLILLVLVLSNGFIFAQNWSLVNPNRTVFYKRSDSLHITNTINIDSLSSISQDTTYYVGYAFRYCDTCQNTYNASKIYRYEKEFLGRELTNDITNNQYVFDNNIIKQNAQVNDSWFFNTNLSATIVAADQMNIIGVLDSFKIIELSNNDTIVISKNYGVIRYPDFENVGKYFEIQGYHEGQNSYGEYLPNFWRTYDFNVGDKFFYVGGYSYLEWFNVLTDEYKVIYEILNDLSTADSVKYLAKVTGYYHHANYGQYFTILNDTIILAQPFNSNDSESIFGKTEVKSYYFMGDTINNCQWPYCSYSFYKHILLDNLFAPIEETADTSRYNYQVSEPIHSPIYGNGKRVYYYTSLNDSLLQLPDMDNFGQFSADYFNNFGRVAQVENYFEAIRNESLSGAIINGDTIGSVFTIPDNIGLDEFSLKKHLTLYPNPSSHQITVSLNYKKVTIFNSIGENVMSIDQKSQTIDVSQLPNGLYYIIVTDLDNNSYSTKFIKQ